jgi:hypothetical protein
LSKYYAFIIALIIPCILAAEQQPNHYLAPLQKGTEITFREAPGGYKITLQSPGTHKVTAMDPDFVTITDAAGVTTIRIGKNAVLSITEIKIPKR